MSSTAAADRRPGRSAWTWIIAGMAFLLGALLGVGIMVTVDDHHRPAVSGATGSDPAASASPGPTTIPAACQQALDRAVAALSTAEAAVDALRHLQTARLQRLLDDLEAARREVDTLTARCHRETGTAD